MYILTYKCTYSPCWSMTRLLKWWDEGIVGLALPLLTPYCTSWHWIYWSSDIILHQDSTTQITYDQNLSTMGYQAPSGCTLQPINILQRSYHSMFHQHMGQEGKQCHTPAQLVKTTTSRGELNQHAHPTEPHTMGSLTNSVTSLLKTIFNSSPDPPLSRTGLGRILRLYGNTVFRAFWYVKLKHGTYPRPQHQLLTLHNTPGLLRVFLS